VGELSTPAAAATAALAPAAVEDVGVVAKADEEVTPVPLLTGVSAD